MSDKTWAVTATSFTFHSFNGEQGLCRKNIRPTDERRRTEAQVDKAVSDSPHLFRKCANCAKKEAEHRARVEASMAPMGEYDQVCEGIVGYGDAATVDAMPTRPDMNAVTEALDSPAVIEALHAEAIAEDARRSGFTPGTRVALAEGGTGVVEGESGVCKLPNHPNYGKVWVTLRTDLRGTWHRRYLEELTNLDALHAEALSDRSGLDALRDWVADHVQ